jgi:fumarylacetoacetate (FAA) hydrolase family protein
MSDTDSRVDLDLYDTAPDDGGALLGRVWRPGIGPAVVTIRAGVVFDITSKLSATTRDVTEMPDPAALVRTASGEPIGPLAAILANSDEDKRDPSHPWLLSPIDLQAIKAAGVTFVVSLIERVIEEQARGNPDRAAEIRREIGGLIGDDLSKLVPGSDEAMRLKAHLIERNAWSQYLEVGIGPDAEIFTKAQVLSSVGTGANVGLHPVSTWNNPEPEIVILVNASGRIIGATLGNDVNLRDVEGRSALLLGKAKDNNASASIGPFIRLFDDEFGLNDVKSAEVSLEVLGAGGYRLAGRSRMAEIARPPEAIAAAAIGRHHQYPDGFALYLGTMFAPAEDRHAPGKGFTHEVGDVVRISSPRLGTLANRVGLSTEVAPWTFGLADFMRNLAGRGLL